MKKVILLYVVILFSNINAKAFNCDKSDPEYDASQCGKCKVAGDEVIKLTKGSKEIKNIDYLITWRASCSEKPPVGVKGNLLILCDADLISQNGASRRIFLWMFEGSDGNNKIGYHLCQ